MLLKLPLTICDIRKHAKHCLIRYCKILSDDVKSYPLLQQQLLVAIGGKQTISKYLKGRLGAYSVTTCTGADLAEDLR